MRALCDGDVKRSDDDHLQDPSDGDGLRRKRRTRASGMIFFVRWSHVSIQIFNIAGLGEVGLSLSDQHSPSSY